MPPIVSGHGLDDRVGQITVKKGGMKNNPIKPGKCSHKKYGQTIVSVPVTCPSSRMSRMNVGMDVKNKDNTPNFNGKESSSRERV